METLKRNLENVRGDLIRQEETIIFALIERAQFSRNSIIYDQQGILIPDFSKSFVDYLLYGTECLHAKVSRYTSPDEFPFFDKKGNLLNKPLNYNHKIKSIYEGKIIPLICKEADDAQYGSSAVCDVNCLQAISKRIHYGIYVAESKFLADREVFISLIKNKNKRGIFEKITDSAMEKKLLARVVHKATTYGQDIDGPKNDYKIKPLLIKDIYAKWLIPLTKKIQVEYLLNR